MLIHIHSSAAIDALGVGESADRSHDCIERLLQMHGEGQHVVHLTPEDMRALQPIRSHLGKLARRAFDRIRQRTLEISSLQERLRWHLEVGLGDSFDGKASPRPGGGQVIRASLHRFDRTTRTLRATFMGEDRNDIAFYLELARVLVAVRDRRSIAIECEQIPGGGSNFAPLFEHLADEGRIILAIADSDRKRPDGPPGETWRKLENKLRKDGQDRPKFQRARAKSMAARWRTWSHSTSMTPLSSKSA